MLVEALHSAAVTLPPAIEVKATEACTVECKVHRNTRNYSGEATEVIMTILHPVSRGTEGLQTHRWRRESRANPSLKNEVPVACK